LQKSGRSGDRSRKVFDNAAKNERERFFTIQEMAASWQYRGKNLGAFCEEYTPRRLWRIKSELSSEDRSLLNEGFPDSIEAADNQLTIS